MLPNPFTIFKMGKVFASIAIASYSVFIVFLLAGKVASRQFDYESAELVSDGGSDSDATREQQSFLHLKERETSEERCEPMYGLLPCATKGGSQFFLIAIYEYLLYQGEHYASGHGRILRVFGESFLSALFYQLLDSLPEALILLATGMMSSKENAQDYVVMGVGLLAGSPILLLTVLWGICFICARTKFDVKPGSEQRNQGSQLLTDSEASCFAKLKLLVLKVKNKVVQLLTDSGVETGDENYQAFRMLISLTPFVAILVLSVCLSNSNEKYNTFLLVSLLLFIGGLIIWIHFLDQSKKPGVLDSILEYAQVERKIEMNVSFYEVQALIRDRDKHLMEKFLKHFEPYDDKMWLDKIRKLMDDPYSNDQLGTEYNQVVELLLEDKNNMTSTELISYMMEFAIGEKPAIHDGILDESSIIKFFERIDTNDDKRITQLELKKYITEVNFNEIRVEGELPTEDEIMKIIFKRLDFDGSGDIDQKEFKYGVRKLLKGITMASRNQQKQSQDSCQEIDKYQRGEAKAKAQKWEKSKPILLLMGGIIMLTLFAEPLVESVEQFSETINIEPFYVSFCLVPLATNARTAITAIKSASQKSEKTTSLMFSEIYRKVFMNNILGLFVIVLVVYFRGLTWHFSVEILVVVIVCSIMGILALFRSNKFPNWVLLIVFPLYPLSLVIVYFFADTFS